MPLAHARLVLPWSTLRALSVIAATLPHADDQPAPSREEALEYAVERELARLRAAGRLTAVDEGWIAGDINK